MNLRILTIAMMIALTRFWLDDVRASAVLASHELGVAFRNQLRAIHDALTSLFRRRKDAKADLQALTDQLAALDERHDTKARAAYHHLLGLRNGSDDPAVVAECDQLLERFFADGLAIVNLSYVEEGGYAEAMAEDMTPELRARLAAITVGEQTLADIFDAWLEAGAALAQGTLTRHLLQASISPQSPSSQAINRNEIRYRWIRTVQAMLSTIGIMGLSEADTEVLLAPLKKSVAMAEKARAEGANEADADDDLDGAPAADDELDGELDADIDNDIDNDSDNDIDNDIEVDESLFSAS